MGKVSGGPEEPTVPPYSFAGASAASALWLALLSVAGSRVGDNIGGSGGKAGVGQCGTGWLLAGSHQVLFCQCFGSRCF